MAFKKVAEISIDKLEDRKTVTAILRIYMSVPWIYQKLWQKKNV